MHTGGTNISVLRMCQAQQGTAAHEGEGPDLGEQDISKTLPGGPGARASLNGQEKTLTPWKEIYNQPRQHIQKQRHYFANKDPSSQGYGFSCGHVWM